MAADSPVVIAEDPLSAIPVLLGTGPAVGISINITTPGTVDIATLNVPTGVDVTVELWAGGSGGATGDNSADGGGGGGGGAYGCAIIPADIWALGGSLVIAASAAGGSVPPANGTAGHSSSLTIDSLARITCTGGGPGVAATGAGGAGGTVTFGAGVTPVSNTPGVAGHAKATTTGGDGGTGGGPGGGAGGAGGTGTSGLGGAGVLSGGGGGGGSGPAGHGGAGAAGRARVSLAA